VTAPRGLSVEVRVTTSRPEKVAALIAWATARSESAGDDELIAAAVDAMDLTVGQAIEVVNLQDAVAGLFGWLQELDPDAMDLPSGYLGESGDDRDPVCAAADRAVRLADPSARPSGSDGNGAES